VDSSESLVCNASRPHIADFDRNGVADRVVAAAGRTRALSVVVNSTPRPLPGSADACRLAVLDFDRDADADILGLTHDGALRVWRNDNGALRLVAPTPGSRAPIVRDSAALVAVVADLTGTLVRDPAGLTPESDPIAFSVPRRIISADAPRVQHRTSDLHPTRAPPIA
jgi:hypothetical protein